MPRLRPVGAWIANRFEIFAVHPGGMGAVYVAHDHLGPPGRSVVAIKTLRGEWLADVEWKARFAAEGALWVKLGTHPNARPSLTRRRACTSASSSAWGWSMRPARGSAAIAT
jgi:hypothetical protein